MRDDDSCSTPSSTRRARRSTDKISPNGQGDVLSEMEKDVVVTEVSVSAEHLPALVLAVHEGSGGVDGHQSNRWRYDNVIDIAGARLDDLDLSKFRGSLADSVEPRVVAGVVVVKPAASVDIVFLLDATTASARFGLQRSRDGDCAARSNQLARFLATQTAAILAGEDIHHTIQL